MKVLARGSVRLYAPRGDYQLQVQVLEPLGKGSLQQAFEELKERLDKEGLFAPERKRPLPLLPRRIGVVTSPTGAVIRDILRVLRVRYANLEVVIYPALVQGPEAAGQVAAGIRALNQLGGLDVLIVARGGGSLEDLWPFNDEQVARALAASAIPTLSAVGHETDYTIADFVADLRAPTPSAAAERVVQAKVDLASRVASLEGRLHAGVRLRLTRVRARVEAVTSHRVFTAEQGRVRTHAQRVDDLLGRAQTAAAHRLARSRDHARRLRERLLAFRPDRQIEAQRDPPAASSEQRLREPGSRAGSRPGAARFACPRRQARHPFAALRARPRLRARLGRLGAAPAAPGRRRLGGRRLARSPAGRRAARHRHREGACPVTDAAPKAPPQSSKTPSRSSKSSWPGWRRASSSLEDSLRLYERGIGLARHCHAKLEEAEGKIELLMKDARGEVAVDAKGRPRTKPFELDEAE